MANGDMAVFAGFHDLGGKEADFLGDVLDGLSRRQKSIPSKYFYDARGSRLFDDICALPEYYPTRTELGILRDNAQDMAARERAGATVVEFGSGSSIKIRLLLDALDRPAAYVPIDISRSHLLGSARALAADYPDLALVPVCGDYTTGFRLGPILADDRIGDNHMVGFFPGSTIGNFDPDEAKVFLSHARETLDGGAMIIGVDLIKPEPILTAAYNDRQGVTAAFNLNLLARINRELGGDFDLGGFAHRARFVGDKGRVEMHLVSRRRQTATIAGRCFDFEAGETIHTENSHKYTVDGFAELAAAAGWSVDGCWIDGDRLFSVQRLAPA